VAIIGAGIAGASLAWALTQGRQLAGQAPLRVLLLEREAQPGYHSTGRSAALYMASYGPPAVRALTRASRDFYDAPPPGFADQPLLSPRGALHVASAAQLPALDALQAELQAIDPTVRRAGQAELLAAVPVLRPETAVAGLVEDSAADIDVHALHQGYLRGARAAGTALRCGAELTALARDDSGHTTVDGTTHACWTLTLADGQRLQAHQVVNAAGAWADVVAGLAGVPPIGLEPRRRTAFTFPVPEGMDATHWPAVIGIDESFYFKPDAGQLLGSPANADPTRPHDVVPEELDVATGIYHIEQMTTFQIRRPSHTWAGLRSFVPDGDMVIGWDNHVPGFFWLAGQGGYGIQSAAGASLLARQLLRGEPLAEELAREGVRPEGLSPARLR